MKHSDVCLIMSFIFPKAACTRGRVVWRADSPYSVTNHHTCERGLTCFPVQARLPVAESAAQLRVHLSTDGRRCFSFFQALGAF